MVAELEGEDGIPPGWSQKLRELLIVDSCNE
jgi:hypothetical protein